MLPFQPYIQGYSGFLPICQFTAVELPKSVGFFKAFSELCGSSAGKPVVVVSHQTSSTMLLFFFLPRLLLGGTGLLTHSMTFRFQFPKALQPLIITFERFKVLLFFMPRNTRKLSVKLRSIGSVIVYRHSLYLWWYFSHLARSCVK